MIHKVFRIVFVVLTMSVVGVAHYRLKSLVTAYSDANSQQMIFPAVSTVRLVSLGFDKLIADFFWLAFVTYVGDKSQRNVDHYSRSEKYIELITSLDPLFSSAYWFAAFTIGGEQSNPRRAAEILDAGIEQNPDNWYIPFIAGINQYLYAGDYAAAARYYRIAASYPGAPRWLLGQAKILESDSPRLIKAANSWLNVYLASDSGFVKDQAREKCIWLWVQVYKTAPNDAYRNRAREVLKELGVDVGSLKKPE